MRPAGQLRNRESRAQARGRSCPRCGYDLGGQIATWTERAPLEGLCPECGLEFLWRDVLNQSYRELHGFVEHSRGAWRFFTWGPLTTLWLVLPSRFCRKVKLHHRHDLLRATLWVGVFVGMSFMLSAGAGIGAIAWNQWRWSTIAPAARGTAGWGIFTPYSSPTSPTMLIPVEGAWYWSPPQSQWRASAIAATWPAHHLVERLFAGYMDRQSRGEALGWSCAFFTPFIAWPTLLLAIPHTRRRAKVRRAHIARAAIYSLVGLGFLFHLRVVSLLGTFVETLTRPSAPGWGGAFSSAVRAWGPTAGWALMVARLFSWWGFVFWLQWRIRRPGAVFLMLGLAVALAITAAAASGFLIGTSTH